MEMKHSFREKPRVFEVGNGNKRIKIKDMGNLLLDVDEQITFMSGKGMEYDVCRKNWGYYATPSVNDRLKRSGFKTALVCNDKGQVYIMLVEKNKTKIFDDYLKQEKNFVIEWLDERPKQNV